MKKNIIIAVGLIFSLFANYSCKNEVDDIFDQSAAQRIEAAMQEYAGILQGAENGWVMQYFASDEEGGYIFLMKFDKNGSVNIAAKNKWSNDDVYGEEVSLYEMLADNGPVLSFNSYNTLFHVFSDPQNIPGSETDKTGQGHLGDYEFVVLSATPEKVVLKGKKRGLEIILTPLAKDQVWEDYYVKLEDMQAKMFSARVEDLYLNIGSDSYVMNEALTHEVSYYPADGDAITQTQKAVFLVNAEGIRFCHPVENSEGVAAQNFKLTEDLQLVCTDEGVTSNIVAPSPIEMLMNKDLAWRWNKDNLGGVFASKYEEIVTQCKNKFRMNFQYFQFAFSSDKYVLNFQCGKNRGNYYGSEVANEGILDLNYDGTGDRNSQNFLKAPAFKEMLDLLSNNDFVVTSSSKLNPTKLLLTSKTNSADFIEVDVQ